MPVLMNVDEVSQSSEAGFSVKWRKYTKSELIILVSALALIVFSWVAQERPPKVIKPKSKAVATKGKAKSKPKAKPAAAKEEPEEKDADEEEEEPKTTKSREKKQRAKAKAKGKSKAKASSKSQASTPKKRPAASGVEGRV